MKQWNEMIKWDQVKNNQVPAIWRRIDRNFGQLFLNTFGTCAEPFRHFRVQFDRFFRIDSIELGRRCGWIFAVGRRCLRRTVRGRVTASGLRRWWRCGRGGGAACAIRTDLRFGGRRQFDALVFVALQTIFRAHLDGLADTTGHWWSKRTGFEAIEWQKVEKH